MVWATTEAEAEAVPLVTFRDGGADEQTTRTRERVFGDPSWPQRDVRELRVAQKSRVGKGQGGEGLFDVVKCRFTPQQEVTPFSIKKVSLGF